MTDVDELVARYHDLRSRDFPGRTAELDQLFGTLLSVVPTVPDFEVERALRSSDAGMRLAGYAGAFRRTNPADLAPTIDALEREETRFNQYWALNTIERIMAASSLAEVPRSSIDKLRSFAAKLPEGSHRLQRTLQFVEAVHAK